MHLKCHSHSLILYQLCICFVTTQHVTTDKQCIIHRSVLSSKAIFARNQKRTIYDTSIWSQSTLFQTSIHFWHKSWRYRIAMRNFRVLRNNYVQTNFVLSIITIGILLDVDKIKLQDRNLRLCIGENINNPSHFLILKRINRRNFNNWICTHA